MAAAIERPADISVERIDGERDAEVRRVMVDRYRHGEESNGPAAFIRDARCEHLDHDERYATLWRRNVPDDEPVVMIEVVNSPPKTEGSFKRYLRPVPPEAQTTREAAVLTFDMPAKDYAPTIES
jgi:hypothetical protein